MGQNTDNVFDIEDNFRGCNQMKIYVDCVFNPVNFNGLSDLGKQSANQIFAWYSRKSPE